MVAPRRIRRGGVAPRRVIRRGGVAPRRIIRSGAAAPRRIIRRGGAAPRRIITRGGAAPRRIRRGTVRELQLQALVLRQHTHTSQGTKRASEFRTKKGEDHQVSENRTMYAVHHFRMGCANRFARYSNFLAVSDFRRKWIRSP
jgi:hypothetical protein